MTGAALGWALALAAVVAGYIGWGWPGVVLAVTVTVFWMLLQFSRALRVLREAGRRPVGEVANAVMLQAQLRAGMRLPELLKITRSLGQRRGDEPETWVWRDAGGDEVVCEFAAGRLRRWRLQRAAAADAAQGGAPGA